MRHASATSSTSPVGRSGFTVEGSRSTTCPVKVRTLSSFTFSTSAKKARLGWTTTCVSP